eukprot:6127482-Ditylum_brightwellii.AAC.1
MGTEVFGSVMTCIRDQLLQDIHGEYLHKKKTDTSDRAKAVLFFNPVVAVKNVEAVTETNTEDHLNEVEIEVVESYQCVHVSFQSTYLCNFSTANALNKCKASAMIRSRGEG